MPQALRARNRTCCELTACDSNSFISTPYHHRPPWSWQEEFSCREEVGCSKCPVCRVYCFALGAGSRTGERADCDTNKAVRICISLSARLSALERAVCSKARMPNSLTEVSARGRRGCHFDPLCGRFYRYLMPSHELISACRSCRTICQLCLICRNLYEFYNWLKSAHTILFKTSMLEDPYNTSSHL